MNDYTSILAELVRSIDHVRGLLAHSPPSPAGEAMTASQALLMWIEELPHRQSDPLFLLQGFEAIVTHYPGLAIPLRLQLEVVQSVLQANRIDRLKWRPEIQGAESGA